MIYTIGKTDLYEQYFREQENPQKGIGGSVWEYWKEAWWHTVRFQCFPMADKDLTYRALINNGYSVYGVIANWKWDTIHIDGSYNDLLVPASLIKVRKEWGGTLV